MLDPDAGRCQSDPDPRLDPLDAARIRGEQYGPPAARTGYQPWTLIPVDVDRVLRDPALAGLADGPAKGFLLVLGNELHPEDGQAAPELFVHRPQP